MPMKEFLETVTQLGDHQHLRRERALNKVTELLSYKDEETKESDVDREQQIMIMLTFFRQMLNSRRWEDRFGAINGMLAIIETR